MNDQTAPSPVRTARPFGPRTIHVAVVVVAVLVLGGIVLGLLWTRTEPLRPVGEPTTAPDFALPALEGTTVTLEDFRGHVVLLNIWATWCVPCREEMPSLEQLSRQLEGRRFVVLGVSIDRDTRSVKGFRDEFALSFPLLLDPRGRIPRLYHANGVPASFLIDGSGVIAERVIGARNWVDEATVQRIVQLVDRAEELPTPGPGC